MDSGNILRIVPKMKSHKSKQAETQETEKLPTLRDETIIKTSINLPKYCFDALKNEAKKQRRTISGQVEIILVQYFALDTIIPDLNRGDLGYASLKISSGKR